MDNLLQIAIDGPVGSGKSDISERLAKELHLTYLYTGAMYRALGYISRRNGVPYTDHMRVTELCKTNRIDLLPPDPGSRRGFKVAVNGDDVTEQLFNPEADRGASAVGVIPEVRARMVRRQQEMATGRSVVMEGRDIGLRVLPEAQLKIYLTASVEERAHRRFSQYRKKGVQVTLEDMVADTKKRDHQDMTRATDPLQKLPDAWELDTTGMSQDEVVAAIKGELGRRGLI